MPAVACMCFHVAGMYNSFHPLPGLTGRPWSGCKGYRRYNRFSENKEKQLRETQLQLRAWSLGDLIWVRDPPCVSLLPDRYIYNYNIEYIFEIRYINYQ